MDFFSINFLIFIAIGLLLYYLVKPGFRNSFLLVLSIIFWGTQSYLTIILGLICLLTDWLILRKVPLDNSKYKLFFISTPYIGYILFYYLAPINIDYINSGFYFDSVTHRNIPSGLFVMCFQSIRNLNLIMKSNKPQLKINIQSWMLMQLCLFSFFCGPIFTFKHFSFELARVKRFSVDNFIFGLKLLFWALLKKIVIVDRLERFVVGYRDGEFSIGGIEDLILVLLIPFFYITFLIGSYCSLGKALGYFFGINYLRNIDIYTYVAGIGNFWSRWLLTIKQMLDEIFYKERYGKQYVYLLLLILNILIFSSSYIHLLWIPFFFIFMFLDFFIQERFYFNSKIVTCITKTISFLLILIFWSFALINHSIDVEWGNSFNTLHLFNNSDLLIFIIILFIFILHIIKRKISLVLFNEKKELEDVSLIGIVFLGYFVIMFGVI